MKILQITGDAVGGVRNHVHEIIREGLSRRYTIHYNHSENYDKSAKADFIELDKDGCIRSALSISKNPDFQDIINILKIRKYCTIHNIEIVHGHGAKGGAYARFACMFSRRKAVYTPHGGVLHDNFNKFNSKAYIAIEKFLANYTHLIFFESEYSDSQYKKKIRNTHIFRSVVNFNGIDVEKYRPINKSVLLNRAEIVLLVVGRLRKLKGQIFAIKALSELIHQGYNIRLEMCGSGPDQKILEREVERLNLKSKINFNGDVKNVRDFYNIADIVLIPSIAESFGYVAVEAALMKKPIVASNVGGLKEIIINNQTGLLIDPEDSLSLANAIKKILSNADNTYKMINNAYQRCVDKYCHKKMLSTIFREYNELLKNNRRYRS